MTRDPKDRSGLKPLDAKFLAGIEQYGWFVTKVAPVVGDDGGCFAYSTGLYFRFRQPEIVMFGLSLEVMHKIINVIGNEMKRGITFVPDQDYSDVLERYSCRFKFVDRSQYKAHLGRSIWFYEKYDFPTLQCFWPDKNGYFPWQSECSPGIRKLQPFLFLPEPDQASRLQ
jgi:hypothetical protein